MVSPKRLDAEGKVLHTFAEDRDGLQRYFATHEAGRHVKLETLQREHDSQVPGVMHEVERRVENMIPKAELTMCFRKLAKGKAPGPDGLRGEVFGAAPEEMSRIFHPVMVKASVAMREPADWKCGFIAAFYKGKGDSRLAKNQRSVHLSNVLCKVHHGCVRQRAWQR
eukprot:963789-Pyramimonas_sp.AAC.1